MKPTDNKGRAWVKGQNGFTLIELLAVISIIGVIAALLIPVAGSVSRTKKINTAQAELQLIETSLESYKAQHGFYPPSNALNPLNNPLYYELEGVTNSNGTYQTMDGNTSVAVSDYSGQFNLGGVFNVSRGTGEDGAVAHNYLPGLKNSMIGFGTNNNGITFYYLVTSVGGPDPGYTPFLSQSLVVTHSFYNPFRYEYPGTNNPNSYDLWVVLSINNTKYLVCNWSQSFQRNTTMP